MALPTQSDLLTLDVADLGEPFVRGSTSGIDTASLDIAYLGEPFVAPAAGTELVEGNHSTLLLPAIIGDGATPGVVLNNTSSATLPLIVPAAGSGRVGLVGNSREGVLDPGVLPALTGTGSGGASPSLPAITGHGSAAVGGLGRSSLALNPVLAAGHASPGTMGRSAVQLAAITGEGGTPSGSALTVVAFEGEARGTSGVVARSAATLPRLVGASTGTAPIVGGSSVELSAPRSNGAAVAGVLGASSATLSALILAAEGTSGALGQSSLALPVVRGEGTGHVQVVGSSILTLPAIVAHSSASGVLSSADGVYSGIALQTQARALTTYSNVPLNGLARFNGVYLASGPGGLFALEGARDDGAFIDAAARLANTGFGEAKLKRVEAMYVSYRTDGDLSLKVIVDEHEEYEYMLVAQGHHTLGTERVKLGRGAKGTHWQFEIANRDGADFAFDAFDARTQVLSRRIG